MKKTKSVRDIAKRAGVSVATVSRALNNDADISPETRDRVLKVATSIGYAPTVTKRNTATVGLVYACDLFFSDFDKSLLLGILNGLARHKLDVTIIDLLRDKTREETFAQFFLRKGLRGAILRTSARHRHLCREIAREGLLSVVIAEDFEEENVNFVRSDSGSGTRRAVEHLIHLGHERIGFVSMVERDYEHEQRFTAFKEVLNANGLKLDPSLVYEVLPTLEGGANALTLALSSRKPPTAILLTDPPSTMGALRRAHELGVSVPAELSIVGFDDSDVRYYGHPKPAAVCQDAARLGEIAADWLGEAALNGQISPLHSVLSTVFEVNQSTAAPPSTPVRVRL